MDAPETHQKNIKKWSRKPTKIHEKWSPEAFKTELRKKQLKKTPKITKIDENWSPKGPLWATKRRPTNQGLPPCCAQGAKMTPRPPPRAPGTLPSLVLGGFLVDFGRILRDCSINLLIDFFIFSSASAVGRGTNRKNKQQTTNWMMVVMMKSMVLVCSLLMPVWGTVAGMPEASGLINLRQARP